MSPEIFKLIEAMIAEKSREIAKTEISRAFRSIADDLHNAFMGGRFDGESQADMVVSYLDDVMKDAANRI